MRKKIFITTGILLNIAMIVVPIILINNLWAIIPIIVSFALTFILSFITVNYNFMLPFWWFLVPKKKIFHKDLGTLYIERINNEIVVYEYNFLYILTIGDVSYSEDINVLTKSFNYMLDNVILERNKKDFLNDWDGYLDKQTKREDKLNDILK